MNDRKVFIVVGVLIASLVCIGACVGVVSLSWKAASLINTERPKVESVIDAFMRAMTDIDTRKAYGLMSTRGKRNMSFADIENLSEGINYVLFEGYQTVTITDFTLTFASDPDPDMPQGQVVMVLGTISYSGGYTGSFSAILEKEGEVWRIHGIDVSAPPAKFGSSD